VFTFFMCKQTRRWVQPKKKPLIIANLKTVPYKKKIKSNLQQLHQLFDIGCCSVVVVVVVTNYIHYECSTRDD
jgi:hypothetical protein